MLTRAVIVLLVMLNLGVALWWLTRGEDDGHDAGMELPVGIARLQLADEAEPGERPTRAAAPEAASAGAEADSGPGFPAGVQSELQPDAPARPAAARCLALGPFADTAAATAARAALPTGASPIRVRAAAPANAPWRVLMPPLADRDAATAMAQRLREAGFTDLFVVADGAEANSIALGRFASETAARSHAQALRQAGFQVRAEPSPGSTRHWLDVSVDEAVDAASLRGATGAARADAVDCPVTG